MNIRKFFLLSLLFLATLAGAQSKNGTTAAKVVCGPYLQNVNENGFTVMWISDIDAMAWVEVAPVDGNSFYYADRPKFYDMSGNGIQPIKKVHKVEVRGLEPGTKYRYRIMMKPVENYFGQLDIVYGKEYGANVYSAEPPVVQTLRSSYDEVNFAVVNDIHQNDSILRVLFSDKKKNEAYDFVLFNGDMSNDIAKEEKIVDCYMNATCETFAAETPFYMSRGNHEFRGKDAIKLMDYFDFPGGKPYYTFKYGKFFFIVLDSGEDKPDNDIEYQGVLCTDPYIAQQSEWLKGVVASEDFRNAERRIVFCHIPPQTQNAWHGNYNVSKYFLSVLNDAEVDIMFSGHTHSYSLRKAGETDARFPVLVNAAEERMEVSVSSKKISIKTFNSDGKQTHAVTL